MKRALLLRSAKALTLTVALSVYAQDRITGIRDLNDRTCEVEYDAERDLRRSEDAANFGHPEHQPGFDGNALLGYSTEDGNTETEDLSTFVRKCQAQGQWVHAFGLV